MTNTILNVPRELKPCPFCGETPELPSGDGTQYEIECGCGQASAGVQICDLMTIEERVADELNDFRYGEEFVERAKVEAIARWNTRGPSPADHVEDARAMVAKPSPAGEDGLETICVTQGGCNVSWTATKVLSPAGTALCRLSDAQAIIDGLLGEVARLREERDSFQRIGIRQIEHRYQLAALLLEKFPRIDPHHPITLSEVDHCCEYVLHKDRERLHCAIAATLSAGKEGSDG